MINCVKCTENGRCSNCGNCCTELIPLTKDEVNLIKAYVKEKSIKPYSDIMFSFNKKESINLMCPFRDIDNKRCMIYEVRPKICRLFKCDQSEREIIAHKDNTHKKAHYNKLVKKKLTKLYSTRELIYGNKLDTTLLLVGNIHRDGKYLSTCLKVFNSADDIKPDYVKRICIDITKQILEDFERLDIVNEGYVEKAIDLYFKYIISSIEEYFKHKEVV